MTSTFNFGYGNNFTSFGDRDRDRKKQDLQNLVAVIIDEISFVKADMLYMLDLRLQEITQEIGLPFGGLSLIVFGDMMQLKPCLGRFICEIPKNPCSH